MTNIMMNPYAIFLLYLLAILGFVAIALFLNKVLGPKPARSERKQEAFECGATPVEDALHCHRCGTRLGAEEGAIKEFHAEMFHGIHINQF